MRLARSWSVALVGLDVTMVEVEVSIGGGLPRTVLVGLPDTSLYEARDRCKAAVSASGGSWPSQLVTINLSPATLPKAGSHYDLPIVAALLGADQVLPASALESTVIMGELGLDGRVRPVRGVLPALVAAAQQGWTRAIVPWDQLREARLADGLVVRGVGHLRDLVALLRGEPYVEPALPPAVAAIPIGTGDLADVVGQVEARWALEVAAAGGHHVSLTGPPGVGKTLLAERLPGILPDLTQAEALEVSGVHSLAGSTLDGLITRPPFSAPHHSASLASLVGGGPRIALPGAISRAHRGVLFLDEAPEFSPRALEALRTPLESGRVVLARSVAQATYPARFQLVLASNPCPCGWARTPGRSCSCAPQAVRRYRERLSGPILDRIDILQELRPLRKSFLRAAGRTGEPTAVVAGRVRAARERARARLGPLGFTLNAEVPGPVLRSRLPVPRGIDLLDRAVARGQVSARGVDKVIRVAWSLADLAGDERPTADHVGAALSMRLGAEETEGACSA